MSMKRMGWLMGVMLLVMGAEAKAAAIKEKMQEPKSEYSADRTIKTEQGAIDSRVYYAPLKQREEMVFEKTKSITIIRTDKNLVWTIMPEQKMYMEIDLGKAKEKSGDITDCKDCNLVDWKPIGTEVVNGATTTKYKFSTSCPKHGKSTGNMWFTKEWIMVKMEVVVSTKEGKSQVNMDLKNLKIGKQSPSLFEVPQGFQKIGGGDMAEGYQSKVEEYQKSQEKEQGATGEEYADLLKEGHSFKLTDWEKAKMIDFKDEDLNFSPGYWKMQKESVSETIIFGKIQVDGDKDNSEGIIDSTRDLWQGSTSPSPPASGAEIKSVGGGIMWKALLVPDGSLKEEGEILCNGNTLKAIKVVKQTMNGRPLNMTCEKVSGTRLGGRDYTSQPRGGRDYTSQPRTGYDYTSQPRRDYTSEPRKDKPVDTLKKGLKGLFGK